MKLALRDHSGEDVWHVRLCADARRSFSSLAPIGPAYWGLGQAIVETHGVAHSEADCVGYFQNAGFVEVAATPFIPGSLARIHGLKPI